MFDDGVRGRPFRALIESLHGSAMHGADAVHLYPDGADAFDRMLEAIAAAHTEVLLETYIMRDDQLGTAVQAALVRAAQRGLRVHVLVDAVGSITTADAFWRALTAHGVVVRHFHRFRHHPLEAIRRDHRKLLIIDRACAFTGGMNIGEEYGSSIRQRMDAWRDTFVEMRGAVVHDLVAVFAEGWDRARGAPLPGLASVHWQGAPEQESQWPVHRGTAADAVPDTTTSPPAGPPSLVLAPRPGRRQRETMAVLAALVGAARERLWITTPYFAPPSVALRMLALAAHRGVDVRLLLPSRRTDVAFIRHAAHGSYGLLLRHGVQLFEYQRATLHAKTLVVDGFASLIGSSNLDFRSFWLNAECNVLLLDSDCGARMEHIFRDDLDHSAPITADQWAARSIGHRMLDRVARSMRWAL